MKKDINVLEEIHAILNNLEKEIHTKIQEATYETALKEKKMKEIEVDAETIASATYSRLSDLMDGDLGRTNPTIEAIEEAEILIKILKNIAERSSFILFRINYGEEK